MRAGVQFSISELEYFGVMVYRSHQTRKKKISEACVIYNMKYVESLILTNKNPSGGTMKNISRDLER